MNTASKVLAELEERRLDTIAWELRLIATLADREDREGFSFSIRYVNKGGGKLWARVTFCDGSTLDYDDRKWSLRQGV